MTLAAAQQFIQKSVNEPDLVRQINAAGDMAAVRNILEGLGLIFDEEEFEPAYFNVLTWCQTHEQAQAVKEVGQWWQYLNQFLKESNPEDMTKEHPEE